MTVHKINYLDEKNNEFAVFVNAEDEIFAEEWFEYYYGSKFTLISVE